MEPNQRFEIQLSHVCNNRCVFCVSGQMTQLKRTRPTPEPEIEESLTRARAQGITKATIMGGEPTIHVTFFPVLRHAVALGFTEIEIFTNGSRFQQKDFLDRVLAVSRDFVWRVSLQGWDEATHDQTTQKPGAFRKIVRGLEYLAARDQRITCNMCVVEQNYRSLLKLPDFVTRFPIRQVHLDMVRPLDAGERTEDYLAGILPAYDDLGRVVRRMFTRLAEAAPDLDVSVGNLPYCQAPEWAPFIHHGGAETLTVSAESEGRISEAWDKYFVKKRDKVKLASCRECVFERRCDGFFELYARRKGTDIFRPVSRDELRALDPGQRTFVHQMSPAALRLRQWTAPGWKLARLDESEPDRWIRLRHETERGFVETLLLPAAGEGGGDGEHDEFVLQLVAFSGVDGKGVAELTAAIFAQAADAVGGRVRAEPTRERIQGRRKVSGPLSPVPEAVQDSLRSLMIAGPRAGWVVRGASAAFDPLGAIVRLAGPRDEGAIVRLSRGRGRLTGDSWFDGAGDPRARNALERILRGVLGAESVASAGPDRVAVRSR